MYRIVQPNSNPEQRLDGTLNLYSASSIHVDVCIYVETARVNMAFLS